MTNLPALFLAILCLVPTCLLGQELPDKTAVMASMELANNYFMAKWPDPGANIVTDKTRPSNLWTRATYYEGLMALYQQNHDSILYNYAVDWGESHDWLPTYGTLTTRDGDHQCCGQTYIELYLLDKKSERITSIKACIDNMVNSTKCDDWSWVDAMHMAMPVFAKLGAVYNDTTYYHKMYDLYNNTKNLEGTAGLYNPDDSLWWRDENFDPPYTTASGKMCYWSRGNGWVYAAHVRVLDVIPTTETHYNEYLSTFKAMSGALMRYQRSDGFWNPSLVDSTDYGGKETSGTAFFVYGLAWGINKGFLDKETYLPSVISGWNGMVNDALHDNGFLGWVQGTGKQPSDAQPLGYDVVPNFEDFGLGAFLLAGSEVYKLAGSLSSKNDLAKLQDDLQFKIVRWISEHSFTVGYSLSKTSPVTLSVFDISGRKVAEPINVGSQSAGDQRFTIDATTLNNGIYILKLQTGNVFSILKLKW